MESEIPAAETSENPADPKPSRPVKKAALKTARPAREDSIRKEATLLVIGVALGLIPSMITGWVGAYYQQRQLVIDRRITAVKDLATTHSQISTLVIPKAEDLLVKLQDAETDLGAGADLTPEMRRTFSDGGRGLCREFVAWTRSLETQRVVLTALYDRDIISIRPHKSQCDDIHHELEVRAAPATRRRLIVSLTGRRLRSFPRMIGSGRDKPSSAK